MVLKDVLVVKFASKQDIKQWDVIYSKNKSSRILEKMQYFRAEGVRNVDRPEICEVARRTIDNV